MVGVTAPAGYGKSTLLAEWAHAEDRRVAWVSLDRFDDDPAALLTLLASRVRPGLAGQRRPGRRHGRLGVSVLGRAAPRLASAFRASPEPFVLMLDDLHELQSPACHDVLGVVISGIPRGSQLVAASRSEQPHLPRLRARVTRSSSWPSDLALDAAGAEQIFVAAHVSLTRELAAAVTERTEGWPVGLYLAALIARDSRRRALTISGDDRYVADYLYRESLVRLPEATQRFLRRTAVLDQLCAPAVRRRARRAGAQDSCAASRRRACSWSRSTAGGSGTATTRCSGSSCSVSCAGSSPTSSRSCTCGPPTGTRRTDPRRWPSSTC